jgi:hypothetical protein
MESVVQKILSRLVLTDAGCLEWPGSKKDYGHGIVRISGRAHYVHRIVYEHFRGPLAADLVLDHLCRNPSCANIEHLEPVTSGENTLRGNGCFAQCARATHCPRGHEYTPENTYLRDGKYRGCRACKKIRRHEAYVRWKTNTQGEKKVKKPKTPVAKKSKGVHNTLKDLLARCLIEPDGCWLWTGYCNPQGYGQTSLLGESGAAHRIIYEHVVGPVPKGLVLDHLCRQPACVNPAHLEPVTHRENILRGEGLAAQQVKRTHCPYGHPYEGDNVFIGKSGSRFCRECSRRRSREQQRKKRQQPS